jgi:hypothetical protein
MTSVLRSLLLTLRTLSPRGFGPGLWMSGVRLLVRAEDAEQAGKILEKSK